MPNYDQHECGFSQIKSSLDSLREKFCPDFDLKAELEKGLVPSPPGSPTRKKSHRYIWHHLFYSGVEYWVSCLSCCFLLFKSQKKVRSVDIWSAKRFQENENRFVTCFSLIQKQSSPMSDLYRSYGFRHIHLRSFVVNVCTSPMVMHGLHQFRFLAVWSLYARMKEMAPLL